MVGDNSLVDTLRVMVSIELLLNANIYGNHPSFSSIFEKRKEKVCSSINSILLMSLSFDGLDSGLSGEDLVKVEAVSNCEDKNGQAFFVYLVSLQLQIGLFFCLMLS